MKEKIEKAIQEAKQERTGLDNIMQELNIQMKVKQAEKNALNAFIDKLEEIKR